ncbi:MAG: EamA family transporter [Alphaproteobacteria bacterium]|nr:EamA family transporter [Alphaproteobacteria bacterium]
MVTSRPWFGVGLALLVAACFAGGSALAGLAYRHGTDPLTVSTARTIAAVLVLWSLLKLRGVPIALPPTARRNALLLGSLVAFYAWSLYQAVALMPVALAVLILYLYPLLTGLLLWALGRERVTARGFGALALAFCGLLLALDLRGQEIAWLGIVFALGGAVGFTFQLVLSSALMSRNPAQPVTLHMLGSAAAIYVVACLALQHFYVPHDAVGWTAFGGSVACYIVGAIGLYSAIAILGPFKAALVLNIEPVDSMIFGYLLLGQTMSPVQLLGAACVIAAITLGRASGRAPAAKPAAAP